MKPFAHQLAELEKHALTLHRALWWEQGTGKTKAVLDTVHSLFVHEAIDALFVLAPPSVEENWIRDEIPKHLEGLGVPYRTHLWSTGRRHTKLHQDSFARLFEADGLTLPVLAMAYPAMMTDDGAKAGKKFLERFRCMMVADESTKIKSPDAKTTKRVLAAARYAKARRALNGTPAADDPFEMFSQVKFVDPNAWRALGINDFTQFKTFFGEWEKKQRKDGREYPSLIRHKNLDILQRVVLEVGSRVLKKDVLDLPPKLYSKRYFEMSPKQSKLYHQLRRDFIVELESEKEITAELAIVRMMRLQQIACGYVKADGDELVPIEEKNPRIACLEEELETVEGSAILWGKYNVDVDLMARSLREAGRTFVTFDGRTDPDDRARAKDAFQAGDVQYFVSKPAVAGRGLTLTRARTVIYYDNDFSMDSRLQSEDRAHRIGQEHPVRYVDILAKGTVDEHILDVLRGKLVLGAQVTGDQVKSWI